MSAFDADIDDETLSRARRRERGALELIYRRFERAAFTLARRMTGSPDAAGDVMQNSFLRAFDRLPQFRGEAPFGRWLRAIVASEALMHLRSGRRFLELFSPEMLESDEPSIEDLSHADLDRVLGLLPNLPRAVLWLYHVEGYTHPEIAAMCGKTVSFSKSQLSRAHQKLRLLLEIEPAEAETPMPAPAPTVTRSALP